MEIVCEDGASTYIQTNSKLEFGRGSGFPLNDQTVSRRHILFQLPEGKHQNTPDSETRVRFQVLGKNPLWVFNNGDTSVFRRSEKGEMGVGDSFCVSARNPILFRLKRRSQGEEESRVSEEERESMPVVESIQGGSEVEGDLGFGSVDVSDIDPVKEFGFLVIGHEFDHYPKKKIRDVKEWDWFLEEQRVDSDTDEATQRKRSKGKKGARRKKDEGYDEEWTGESEDEKEVISKVRNAKKPRYTTRSRDSSKPVESVGASKSSEQKKTVSVNEDEEEELDDNDEEDEDTLGGFIVDEEEVEEDEDDDEEEEEFEEDDDDEDD